MGSSNQTSNHEKCGLHKLAKASVMKQARLNERRRNHVIFLSPTLRKQVKPFFIKISQINLTLTEKNLFNLILAGSISLAFLVCNRDKVNLKLYIYFLFFVQISKFQRCGIQRA